MNVKDVQGSQRIPNLKADAQSLSSEPLKL